MKQKLSNVLRTSASKLIAADAVNDNDLLSIWPDGKVRPVGNLNYANATTKNTLSTQYKAGATLDSSPSTYNWHFMMTRDVIRAPDGTFYKLSTNSGANGLVIRRYNFDMTTLMAEYQIESSSQRPLAQMVLLPDGNVAVAYYTSTSTSGTSNFIRYIVLSSTLTVVKATANIPTQYGNAGSSSIGLQLIALQSGFAIAWTSAFDSTAPYLATFDTAGTTVAAPFKLLTTSGVGYFRIGLLSTGNIAVAIMANATVGGDGLYVGVYSPSGTVVTALSSTTITNYLNGLYDPFELAVEGDYFAVLHSLTYTGGSHPMYVKVYNNLGVAQGPDIFINSTVVDGGGHNIGQNATFRLIGGRGYFWCLHSVDGTSVRITRISTSGQAADAVSYGINGVTGWTNNSGFMPCFESTLLCWPVYDGGYHVSGGNPSANGLALAIFDTDTFAFSMISITTSNSWRGASACIPCGDGIVAYVMRNNSETSAPTFGALKVTDSSIVGVALQDTAQDGKVPLDAALGFRVVNKVKGTATTFDHTAAPIPGRKGTLFNNATLITG